MLHKSIVVCCYLVFIGATLSATSVQAQYAETKLSASDTDAGDQFGVAVSISGNTAIVTANSGEGNVPFAGAAYGFDVTTGAELFKLTASDGAQSDRFGFSAAIDDNTAIGNHANRLAKSRHFFPDPRPRTRYSQSYDRPRHGTGQRSEYSLV